MRWPRITVVTPSFNQGRFLEETIQSVLYQDYPNLEYIVIDGGSTDGSSDIIRRYSDQLAYWVSRPDRGQTDALIQGFGAGVGGRALLAVRRRRLGAGDVAGSRPDLRFSARD